LLLGVDSLELREGGLLQTRRDELRARVVEFDEASKRAFVDYVINYRLKGETETSQFKQRIAVKLAYSRDGRLLTTDDAVLGKARRKALWTILRGLKGVDLGEGDLPDRGEPRNVTPERTTGARSAFATAETTNAQ
jgi:hypothetical protein